MVARISTPTPMKRRRIVAVSPLACIVLLLGSLPASGEEPQFYRAINLNGPALVIDNHSWEAGREAPDFLCEDASFENQQVTLTPPVDGPLAAMIRSSLYSPGGKNLARVSAVPPGTYSVYLYLWEDNDAQTFDISLERRVVAERFNSGLGGTWHRLGPWVIDVADGTIELTAAGGHANFSGIEIWRGRREGGESVPTVSAPAERPARTGPDPKTTDRKAGYDWWSLQPITRPEPPAVRDGAWAKNEIDRFILAKLEEKKITPAPEADRRTLIRRVSFDLLGLPPAPEEVEAFVADPSEHAYEQLVDRLLASPHYGERWARHWLDVIRFGESQGFERNISRPNAWRYRDWLIAALNDDMPYDQFVRLQIAGDVPRPQDPLAITATGYLVAGPYDKVGLELGTEAMKETTRQDYYEELAGNVAQTFIGLTVNCARCHDHKFDPIEAREYYEFASIFAGVEHGDRETLADPNAQEIRERREKLKEAIAPIRAQIEQLDGPTRQRLGKAAVAKADAEASAAAAAAEEAQKQFEASGDKPQNEKDQLKQAADQAGQNADAKRQRAEQVRAAPASFVTYDEVMAELPAGDLPAYRRLVLQVSRHEAMDALLAGGPAHAVAPRAAPTFHVLARGDFTQKGEVVSPRAIEAVKGLSPDFGLATDAPEAERRRKLAEWATHPANPLTARVIVNRIWQYHFGTGIVSTPNDLGFNGDRPSHPELLDWLASQLIENGWSLKRLHRTILLSATYRQSAQANPAAADIDAQNRLLWRKTPSRLEAEALRDAVLAVAGELNPRMGGPGFDDHVRTGGENFVFEPIDVSGPSFYRRSIYRTWNRSGTSALLDALDCPDPSVATPRRSETTTPLQALSLLNNIFMQRMADSFAERLKREAGEDPSAQADRAYALAYNRTPDDDEKQAAVAYVAEQGLAELCLLILNSNEFVYVE